MMNNTKKDPPQNKNMYDVNSYTDRELLDILDLTNPSDRELEAKIIFFINKYKNMQNDSGDELTVFFEEIYSHFFETSDDDDDESILEGMDEIGDQLTKDEYEEVMTQQNTSEDIINTLKTEDPKGYLETSQAKMDKVTNYTKELEHAKGNLNPLLQQTVKRIVTIDSQYRHCLLYTSPSPRDRQKSRMPSSA